MLSNYKLWLSGAVLGLATLPASAVTFNVDGIYDPATDGYTHQFVVPLVLDDGTYAGNTAIRVGIGSNADGVTGGPNDLFAYFELPLTVKDMTWGDGTHDGYLTSPQGFKKTTGSEKITFNWDGSQAQIKLKLDDGVGHVISDDADGAVIDAATSLDYIINNFSSDLWGDDSSSPLLKEVDGKDTYETVNPDYADWPFHQAWEVQIAGSFSEADLADLLTSPQFFGVEYNQEGDKKKADSNLYFHVSPTKAGENFDIIPQCESCGIERIPTPQTELAAAPEPASMGLLAVGIGGLALTIGRRRRRDGDTASA